MEGVGSRGVVREEHGEHMLHLAVLNIRERSVGFILSIESGARVGSRGRGRDGLGLGASYLTFEKLNMGRL